MNVPDFGTQYPVPSTQYSVPSSQFPVPSTQYLVPSIQYPVSRLPVPSRPLVSICRAPLCTGYWVLGTWNWLLGTKIRYVAYEYCLDPLLLTWTMLTKTGCEILGVLWSYFPSLLVPIPLVAAIIIITIYSDSFIALKGELMNRVIKQNINKIIFNFWTATALMCVSISNIWKSKQYGK